MLQFLPPPPPQSPSPKTSAPPSTKQTISKQSRIQQSSQAETITIPEIERPRKHIILLQHPRPHERTNPIVWCGPIMCLILSLILIFFGIATVIIYLVIKPRNPVFDTPNANLNTIYFDLPEYFNGDLTSLANFSNPNKKIDVRFEYVDLELYFCDRLIGTHALQL